MLGNNLPLYILAPCPYQASLPEPFLSSTTNGLTATVSFLLSLKAVTEVLPMGQAEETMPVAEQQPVAVSEVEMFLSWCLSFW